MEERRVYKQVRRVTSHLEAGSVEGLEHVGWFPAITSKGVTKILNGSGIERDFDDDKEDIDDIDDAIQIRTYTLDHDKE